MAERLTIEDREYGLHKMPPKKAVSFGFKVLGALAPALGGAVGSLDSMKDQQKIGEVILAALAQVDPEKLEQLAETALAHEVYAGDQKLSNPSVFNKHFQDYPGDYFPVAIWAIWENAKDFFVKSGPGFQQVLGVLPFSSQKGGTKITS